MKTKIYSMAPENGGINLFGIEENICGPHPRDPPIPASELLTEFSYFSFFF